MKSLPGRKEVICLITVLLMLLTSMGFAGRRSDAECLDSPSITAVRSTGSELIWSEVGSHEGATLVIYGPGGVIQERDFGVDAIPEYDFIHGNGAVLQDGNYSWELRLNRGYQEAPDPERLSRRFLLSRGHFEMRDGWPEVQQARECVGHITAAVDNTGHPEFAALYDVSGDWTITGDMGVGTDLPTASVDVRRTDGTAKIVVEDASGTAAVRTLFQLRNNGAPRFAVKNTGSGIEWSFQQSGPGNFLISKEGTGGPEMQVYQTGMVRMGPGGTNNFTLYPNGNLFIAGSLTANGSTFPDYVFEPGYELMPLENLREFIEEENRLPGIPAAEDVEKQGGHNMTELQLKLLEKIEELTLYTLEQERQLRVKDARIAKLEKEMAGVGNLRTQLAEIHALLKTR